MFEIEIKSLLGTKDVADLFREKLLADNGVVRSGGSSQLNHYFEGGENEALYIAVSHLFSDEKKERLHRMLKSATAISIRSREYKGDVFFVVKTTVDSTTSENGTAREEFEEKVEATLAELDKVILDSGWKYQAKWSRVREEYRKNSVTITIDKNAGYGYLVEFEKMLDDKDDSEIAKIELRAMMKDFGLEELHGDRLARMFAHYNANWRDYYGTDKVFTIL
ncbi:MAG: hypothetical protein COV07_00065 [Candidatus Vogelbacteria bacterium CG10_big_fil_rev_8_21_14_0_10_45_14]|uniref:CYTH domain-containing protein n=1 Tax=Candidatus Vogelbacteria bacterium CG10_big_fil_rev_8_21_14_0_10_45_14 TaxID=1975042 RepID=A0A2H0RL52_9BACT|nr:MAG: hypothetical protein COV07_00065 [Candidatus Vogelbacteria bacterium CG10_big_fil_rev_8_21_14_0_10_45_14]